MKPLVDLIKSNSRNTWISHFGWRPATLFEGVNIPLSICISSKSVLTKSNLYSTEFHKWYKEKRMELTSLIQYTEINQYLTLPFVIPKIPYSLSSIFKKLSQSNSKINNGIYPNGFKLYYRNTGGLYWRIIINFKPKFKVNGVYTESSTLTSLSFKSQEELDIATALLNTNLFWAYYVSYSSFHHVNPIDLISFPLSSIEFTLKNQLSLIKEGKDLMEDLKQNSIMHERNHQGGNSSTSQTFFPSKSKGRVDKIDQLLAIFLNFTESELDQIINYDIVFRGIL
jgi:hypothetical protein